MIGTNGEPVAGNWPDLGELNGQAKVGSHPREDLGGVLFDGRLEFGTALLRDQVICVFVHSKLDFGARIC